MSERKGLLISFEGIDKCGKSTQVERLRSALETKGKSEVIYREPGSTHISEQIRRILLSNDNFQMNAVCETLLYSAARAQLVAEKILPALENGTIVILDRFYHSTTAYQGYGRGLPLDFIDRVNSLVSQEQAPDVTFILDITPEEASKRRDEAGRDRLEMSSLQFFQAVRRGYLQMASADERLLVIDGTLPIDKISDIVLDDVLGKLHIAR